MNFYIVTELCTGGELFDRIVETVCLSEAEAVKILKQIISAVRYCHKKGIVHRDLKPENILYESRKPDSQLKIIDFGTSRKFEKDQNMHAFHGTVSFLVNLALALLYCTGNP